MGNPMEFHDLFDLSHQYYGSQPSPLFWSECTGGNTTNKTVGAQVKMPVAEFEPL